MPKLIVSTNSDYCREINVNGGLSSGGGNRPTDKNDGFPIVDDKTANDIFKTAMTVLLMEAKKWIRAAQANLDIALQYVDDSGSSGPFQIFGREERMRLANKYFKIDDFPARQRGPQLQRIRFVYSTMLQIFERPGGLWGEKAFEMDSSGVTFKENSAATAHTVYGGFFRGGQPNIYQKELRGDTIYFVRENISYFTNQTKGVKTIVHELAHFCGNPKADWSILDFDAYGEPDDPKVAKLTLAQRVRHADTYARFAKTAGS
jgi:hypothetical protein